MQETQAQSLGPEDPPGEGNGNPSSILAWENPLDRGGLQSTGLQKSRTDSATSQQQTEAWRGMEPHRRVRGRKFCSGWGRKKELGATSNHRFLSL